MASVGVEEVQSPCLDEWLESCRVGVKDPGTHTRGSGDFKDWEAKLDLI